MAHTKKADVDEFMALKNLAVYGASRNPKKFGGMIFKELKEKGYNVVPVNPNSDTIQGETCYKDLGSIPGTVDGVIMTVKPDITKEAVKEAHKAGIKSVWMQYGSNSADAVAFCQENGMKVISRECVFMFVEPVKNIHKFHRFFARLFGTYPN